MTGIDEFLSGAVSRIKPHFESHGRIARALVKFKDGLIGWFKAGVRNGPNRLKDLGFICIPNLHDVPICWGIGQFEDIGPRRQNLPGDFHCVAEGDDGFLVPLIRSGARGECGAEQHSAYCKYSSSQCWHATTLLVGWAGRNGQGWRLRKLGRPKPATRTDPRSRAVLLGPSRLLPRPCDAPPPPEVAPKVPAPPFCSCLGGTALFVRIRSVRQISERRR